jgi:hypothetical protein
MIGLLDVITVVPPPLSFPDLTLHRSYSCTRSGGGRPYSQSLGNLSLERSYSHGRSGGRFFSVSCVGRSRLVIPRGRSFSERKEGLRG